MKRYKPLFESEKIRKTIEYVAYFVDVNKKPFEYITEIKSISSHKEEGYPNLIDIKYNSWVPVKSSSWSKGHQGYMYKENREASIGKDRLIKKSGEVSLNVFKNSIKESGSGKHAAANILFKTDYDFDKALELLKSLKLNMDTNFYTRKGDTYPGYSKNYFGFTYAREWTKLVKLLQKNDIPYKLID